MLTAAEIAQLVQTLQPRVVNGQVQKIREPLPGTVVLHVRVPGRSTRLVLSARPGVARIAEAEAGGETLPEPTTLGRWLRSALKGRRLLSLTQEGGDRVVRLTFEAGALVAELTGRSANLYAVAADGRVVATARKPLTGARDLRPGHPYVSPAPRPTPEAAGDGPAPDPVEIEAKARALEGVALVDAQTQRHRQVVRRARQRLERLAKKVRADVVRAEGAAQWAHWGELLKTQLWAVKRGDTSVALQDWYAEGAPMVEVPLDPALDGPQNLAQLFKRAKRARAGTALAAERLVAVEAQLSALDALAAAEPDPDRLAEALLAAGLDRPKAGGGTGRRGATARLPYRLWHSARGDRIWVGRGGADNHTLTFSVARGNDQWLHVRDVPGAHVIVPGAAPHPETLLDAAALAAFHSDLRDEPLVDVSVTQRKHLRPVKGAPGRVTVAAARTLTVEHAAQRVQGLTRAP